MSGLVQVCLYNADEEASSELRSRIGELNFVRLVSEVRFPADLAVLLDDGGVNLIFFHLDPQPETVVALIAQVAERHPEVASIAIGHNTSPDAILAPIRAGCDQFVCEPIDPADLAAAVARVATKRLLSKATSRCICVVGASGGAGATSMACNLAMEIAELTEKECALVDLDFQLGDLATNFDCDAKYTFYDVAQSGPDLDRAVLSNVLTQVAGKVRLLARPTNLDQAQAIHSDVVHHTIEVLTAMFETVVVDLPRRMDTCVYAAVSQANLVLVVCQLLVPSIRNARRFADALTHAGVPAERIEFVVNRGDSTGGRVTLKDLEELIRKPVFGVVPNDYHFVARSLDYGRPIASLEGSNPIRKAISAIARQILGPGATDRGKRPAGKGLLSRLLSK